MAVAACVPDLVGPNDMVPAGRVAAVEVANNTRTFAQLPDSALWRLITQMADSVATVGLKAPTAARGAERGMWRVSRRAWQEGVESILAAGGAHIVQVDTLLPWVRVRFSSQATLHRVRGLPHVEYVEPSRFVDARLFDSGCEDEVYPRTDFFIIDGDILPQTYRMMGIERAWGYASGGRGVRVGLVDTGVDPATNEISAYFATGESANRSITFGNNQSSPACSHGTRLAGVIAAPKNGSHVIGVAWAADLFTYRHDDNLAPQVWGNTTDGIRASGNAGSRVINMAFGTGFSYSSVRDEIEFWYYQRDVVFVGAAGTWEPCTLTNSNNVLFPAELPEVLATSPANHDGLRPCTAAYGPALDLVAMHDQPTTGRASAGFGSTPVRVMESSNASAIVSGVAALVRQRFPLMTNAAVYNRLISTRGFACGQQSAWGNYLVNAEAAVGGVCLVGGSFGPGPYVFTFDQNNPDQVTIRYEVQLTGGTGPLEIQWSNGTTGPVAYYTFYNQQQDHWWEYFTVSVRDAGTTLPAKVFNGSMSMFDRTNWSCDPTQISCP